MAEQLLLLLLLLFLLLLSVSHQMLRAPLLRWEAALRRSRKVLQQHQKQWALCSGSEAALLRRLSAP